MIPNSMRHTDSVGERLVRLPLWIGLEQADIDRIVSIVGAPSRFAMSAKKAGPTSARLHQSLSLQGSWWRLLPQGCWPRAVPGSALSRSLASCGVWSSRHRARCSSIGHSGDLFGDCVGDPPWKRGTSLSHRHAS